jgi:hypothetical protein
LDTDILARYYQFEAMRLRASNAPNSAEQATFAIAG